MLSSCSPSATLLNASVPPGGAFHSSGSLVFVATAQGMSLNQLALVAGGGGGLHSWVIPKECGSRKDSSWPGTTSQALHRQQTGTPPPIPSFSVKEASLLSSNYGLRGRLQVWHMSSGLRSYSQGTDVVLPLSLCLAPAHQYLCLVPAHQYLQLTSISHTCQEP